MSIRHAFVNPKADSADTTITRPSDWNADHVGNNLGAFDVTDYGAVGDGTTDDTTAVQAAFTASLDVGYVYLPDGDYLVGTINYKGQSIVGNGLHNSRLIGKPSQDVLHLDPSVTEFARDGMFWRDFMIMVDDTVDASASFPQRGGIGNAGFAADFANGAGARPLLMNFSDISNIDIWSVSGPIGGQNKSCGIYTQFQSFNQSHFRNVRIGRLDYGFWDHYPTSNLTSSEHARDHNHYDKLYFNGCGRAWRMVNQEFATVTNLTMHHNDYGLEMLGVISQIRTTINAVSFDTVSIEFTGVQSLAFTRAERLRFRNFTVAPAAGESVLTMACDGSLFDGFVLMTPSVLLTGNLNTMTNGFTATSASLADQGYGNRIELIGVASGSIRVPRLGNEDSRVLLVRDVLPMLSGHVSPMPLNLSDLLLNPRSILPTGYTEGTEYTRVMDATADFGQKLHVQNANGNWYTDTIGVTGTRWPLTKLRVYVKAKFATGGTQVWAASSAGTGVGTATLTFTTSYTVQSFDIDLSARAVGETVLIQGNNIGGGGAAPADIAWVAARPWSADMLSVSDINIGTVKIVTGAGTPEAVVTAPIGSIFLRTNGGAGTAIYVKETGTGNTGWVGK